MTCCAEIRILITTTIRRSIQITNTTPRLATTVTWTTFAHAQRDTWKTAKAAARKVSRCLMLRLEVGRVWIRHLRI